MIYNENDDDEVQLSEEDNDIQNDDDSHQGDDTDSIETNDPAPTNNVTGRYNLRGHKINYDHRYDHAMAQLICDTPIIKPKSNMISELKNHAICRDFVMTQYGVKSGVSKYGEAAVKAIMQECDQLNQKDVIHPVHKKDIDREK